MSDEPDHFATSKSWVSVDAGDTSELLLKAAMLITLALSAHKPGENFKRYAERWLHGYDLRCGTRRLAAPRPFVGCQLPVGAGLWCRLPIAHDEPCDGVPADQLPPTSA